MTLSSSIALFAIMLAAALVPSVSVVTVVARSAAFGFVHGLFTTLGIVAGDIIFILFAIFGLALLVDTMDGLFVLVKYAGGVYLLWLGLLLWRAPASSSGGPDISQSSLASSFATGLLITLADQKAVLFYFGLFPAFVDMSALSAIDAFVIISIAIVAVGGAKLCYAVLACRAGLFRMNTNAIKWLNRIAGAILSGVGLFLLVTA